MDFRSLLARWFALTIPDNLAIATLEEREFARKLRLNSQMILIALVVITIYLIINFWPIDLGTLCNVLYVGLIILAGKLNKICRLMIANCLLVFGALIILSFDMAFVVKNSIGLLWIWSMLVLLPAVSGVLLNKKLPMITGGCILIALLGVVTLRFSDYTHYVQGYSFILLVSYMIVVNAASAGLAAFYAQSVNEAIRQSDRAYELEILHERLQQSFRQLDALSNTDQVTGLKVRRCFFAALEEMFLRSAYPVSLIFSDIDHFKHVNDTWGHQAGDVALAHIAACYKRVLWSQDLAHVIIARYGGEEFVIVAPHMTHERATDLAEQLRQAVAATPCDWQSTRISLTCSLGVATAPRHGTTPDALIDAADQAMYLAKHQGRNCIMSPIITEAA